MTTRVVSGFDRDAWSAFPSTSPLTTADWLSVMITRLPGEVFTAVRDGELGFVGALVTDPDAYEAYNPYALLLRDPPVFGGTDSAARSRALSELRASAATVLPALVLVAPGYLGDPVGPARQAPDVLADCLQDVFAWGTRHTVVSCHVMYTQQTTKAVAAAVAKLGGATYPLTSRWQLPVGWQGWDDYLMQRSGTRRAKIRRELRRCAAEGVSWGRLDVERHFERIVEARCGLLLHYRQQVDEAGERRRLRDLASRFGTRLLCFGASRHGDLLAVVVCVRHGRSLTVVYSGASDAGFATPYAHFVAAYYAVIQSVGPADLDEIDYGIGHGEEKSLRGCRPAPLHGHVVAADSERRRLLGIAARWLSPGTDPVPTQETSTAAEMGTAS